MSEDILKKLLVEPGQETSLKVGDVVFRWRKLTQFEVEQAIKPLYSGLKPGQKPTEEIQAQTRYYVYSAALVEPKLTPKQLMKLDPKYGVFLMPELDKTLGIGEEVDVVSNFLGGQSPEK